MTEEVEKRAGGDRVERIGSIKFRELECDLIRWVINNKLVLVDLLFEELDRSELLAAIDRLLIKQGRD